MSDLAPLAALHEAARVHAIGSRARGDYDNERRWLDALVLLEQAQKVHGRLLAEAKGEALREAAEAVADAPWDTVSLYDWLRDRADQTEAIEENADA